MRIVLVAGILVGLLSGCRNKSSVNLPVVRIAAFQGDRIAAITYTFDDGIKDQADVAAPMLDKLGFKATFFIIPSAVPEGDAGGYISWSRLRQLAGNGHEIANHSWSHPDLRKLSDSLLIQEIDKAARVIKDKTGVLPVSFAFPYNAFGVREHDAVMAKHPFARTYQYAFGSGFTAQAGNRWADNLVRMRTWGVIMMHGIRRGYDALGDEKQLEDHLNYVKKREDKIWVGTFARVARYERQRDNVKLTVTRGKNQVSCWVTTASNKVVYNEPLTVVVDVKGVKSAEACRLGKKYGVKVFEDKLTVDFIPGPDPVIIRWQ